MKKLILFLLFLIPFTLIAQNSVRIIPNRADVCENTTISVLTPGNSFVPQSYLWNTGASTQSIVINTSGTYICTVTGIRPGRNGGTSIITVSQTYTILSKPTINIVKGPWVCRFDTVILSSTVGYNNYVWNNGTTLNTYTSVRDSIYGVPTLDTTTVWYTASIPNVCSINSDTIVIRGVRAPNGVGSFYCGKTDININDSIPAGLVLDYLFPNQYEMEFTQVSDPSVVITYLPPLGSRKTPANILTPGEQYYVRSRVIINGQTFCWGTVCLIGIRPPVVAQANRGYDPRPIELDFPTVAIKEYRLFTMEGKLINTYKSEMFNEEWLGFQPQGIYIVHVIYQNNIVAFKYQK